MTNETYLQVTDLKLLFSDTSFNWLPERKVLRWPTLAPPYAPVAITSDSIYIIVSYGENMSMKP
jgi:hypothetical protein